MPVRPLFPELAEKARVELFENPQKLQDSLDHLKDWIAKQPHLNARTDDQWLAAFLRGCKFSLERTKEKLDLYYTCRKIAPEICGAKHTDTMFKEILELGCIVTLPKPLSPDGPLVSIVRPGVCDPDKYNIKDTVGASYVIQKIIMMEKEHSVVAGIVTIVDLDNVTMGHFLQMTPSVMKTMVVAGQDATPFRLKGVHYLNTPTGFETIFNFVKGLLNEKNKKRLYVHNKKYEDMYKVIPQEILPSEYGGKAGSIKDITEYWKKKVEEYSEWLTEDEKFGTDESKRPGKPKTAEDMFGLEGSFRKLEVD